MSKSFKKHPVCTDSHRDSTSIKRVANKAVRQCNGSIPNGRAYRKLFCSWNICDYKFRNSLEEFISLRESFSFKYEGRGLTDQEITEETRYWYRVYKNK
jgi:hypothetical protein